VQRNTSGESDGKQKSIKHLLISLAVTAFCNASAIADDLSADRIITTGDTAILNIEAEPNDKVKVGWLKWKQSLLFAINNLWKSTIKTSGTTTVNHGSQQSRHPGRRPLTSP
jgi:hypothetical protein